MAETERTLYEVLGVPHNAKNTDVTRAYNRLQGEMKKETAAPNARLVAQAKVAYETLSDPQKRDEYDALLRRRALMGKTRKSRGIIIGVAVVAVIGGIGAGYYAWQSHKAAEAAIEKPMTPEQLLVAVAPNLWHVQGALMSGEVRDLGTAIATGEGKMVTTCRGLAAGMVLTVKSGEYSHTAELSNPNEEIDICVLTAKGVNGKYRVRGNVPDAQEKLHAVFMDANGNAEMRQVSGAHAVADAPGPALEVKAAAALPNGTAIFDPYGKLVGLVAAPHAATAGHAFALGPMRIAQAKGTAAEKEFVEPPPPPRHVEPIEPTATAAPATSDRRPPRNAREKAYADRDAATQKAIDESTK